MHAQVPGPAMAWRMPAFFARHPSALTVLPGSVKALRPLESYATTTYYALHAYRFLDADGGSRYVRYTIVPEAGETRISPAAAKRRGPDYLQQDIRERVARAPVRFSVELQGAG